MRRFAAGAGRGLGRAWRWTSGRPRNALIAAGLVAAVAVAGAFVWSLDKTYPGDDVVAWCNYAQALEVAKMRDRAYVAYRSLHEVDPEECDAAGRLSVLRFQLRRRAQLLEGARAFRRSADLARRAGFTQARKEAVRDAFAAYQDALEFDPYAEAARRGFLALIATYRRIDPQAPDCKRSRGIAGAGLLPEGRLYLTRALRTGNGNVCRVGLVWIGQQRANAYQHLRVAQAREHARDEQGAREAYAAALGLDASLRPARAGLRRQEPPQLEEEEQWAGDVAGFLGKVLGVVPTPIWALVACLLLGFGIFAALWFSARGAANRSDRAARVIGRLWVLRGAPQVKVEVEGTDGLGPVAGGMVEDTLAWLDSPWTDRATGARQQGLTASPKGAAVQAETPFSAVEPFGFAAGLLRWLTAKLQSRSDVALVLEGASAAGDPPDAGNGAEEVHAPDGDGRFAQRWRVIDRQSRRTLKRVELDEDRLRRALEITPPERRRLDFFVIYSGEMLRSAIVDAREEQWRHNGAHRWTRS